MSTLHIRRRRLADEGGHTSERCGATEAAVDDAVGKPTAEGATYETIPPESIAPAGFPAVAR